MSVSVSCVPRYVPYHPRVEAIWSNEDFLQVLIVVKWRPASDLHDCFLHIATLPLFSPCIQGEKKVETWESSCQLRQDTLEARTGFLVEPSLQKALKIFQKIFSTMYDWVAILYMRAYSMLEASSNLIEDVDRAVSGQTPQKSLETSSVSWLKGLDVSEEHHKSL